MIAGRAHFRRIRAYYDVTAVAALPYLHFTLREYLRRLDILQECAISLLMVLLNRAYQSKLLRQLFKAFLLSSFGKILDRKSVV